MVESCMVLGLLGICSIEDIKSREIGVYKIYLSGIIGVLLHLFLGRKSVYSILGGMLIGFILLIVGKTHCHANDSPIQKAIRELGVTNFIFEILEICF